MPRPKKTPPAPAPKVRTLETFRQLSSYTFNDLREDAPSCFNGFVNVRRYRITIEELDEPTEVIYERLLKLWRECANQHHWQPLQTAAARIGKELPEKEYGKARPRK